MTRWIDRSSGGRGRGLAGLARAWLDVMVRPRRFFRDAVVPGDQAAGLAFAMSVVLVEEGSRLLLVEGAVPAVAGGPLASAVVAVGVAVVLVTPVALHLVSGLLTLLLLALLEERGGVSETVQVVGYATAPCAFAGLPFPEVRLACAGYGAVLLAVGVAEVHDARPLTAAAASALPVAIVFGYGFRGFAAAADLLP